MDKTIQGGGGRIAIYLYGHMRTYKNTYKKFLENIVNPNIKDGWKIDIFIHTWDIFSITDPNVWHAKQNLFPTLDNKKLTQTDMNEIINIYTSIGSKGLPFESTKRLLSIIAIPGIPPVTKSNCTKNIPVPKASTTVPKITSKVFFIIIFISFTVYFFPSSNVPNNKYLLISLLLV